MVDLLRSFPALSLFLFLLLSPFAGAGADADLFPLNPGNTWTYRDLEGNLETLTITGIVERKGVPLIEASYDGGSPFFYILGSEGIYRLQPAPGSDPENPRGELTMLFQWPLEPGRTWQSPWSDPPMSFKVLDRGPIKVASGDFRHAVKVGYRPVSSPIHQGYIWFEPGVGLLAQEESAHRTELVSYSFSELLPPAPAKYNGDRLARIFSPPAAPGTGGSTGLGQRIRELALSGPFFLFVLLVLIGIIALAAYLRTGRVDMDLQNAPEVQEGEATLASAMVREGLYEDASVILQRLTAKHPQWPDIAAMLGRAYRETGKHREACLELKRALTLNPDMAKARLELVRTYLELNETSRALDEVETVLSENEGFADAVFLKGEVLSSMGLEEEALEHFREALKINPAFAEAQNALEKLLAGEGR